MDFLYSNVKRDVCEYKVLFQSVFLCYAAICCFLELSLLDYTAGGGSIRLCTYVYCCCSLAWWWLTNLHFFSLPLPNTI